MITGVTSEGLRYAVLRRKGAVAYSAMSVGSGTRDEVGFHKGIAHFAEHAIFKGTAHKKASQINGALDKLGGELNAFTTKEETVFHTTVLKEDFRKASDMLFDLVSSSIFPQKEVETEKGVVIDEIAQYKDSPSEDIYDCFEEMIYGSHALGGRILGTSASVRKITSQELLDYRRSRFLPENMAFSMVADVTEKRMEQYVHAVSKKYFGQGDFCKGYKRELSKPRQVIFDKTVDKRNHEANAIVGSLAPCLYDGRERLVCVLLCNILGGPASNSLLNASLREKNGWVYGVECAYTQYSDSGIVTISMGCDRDNLEKCFAQMDRILEDLKSRPLSAAKLRAAKKQLVGQLMISSDNGETQCLSMGKNLLAFGKIASNQENMKAIEEITSEDIMSMAERIFDKSSLSKMVYL